MASHADERPDAPEPPSLTDPAAADREIASFVRRTVDDCRSVDDTARELGVDLETVARFAGPVERTEHKRIPPLTPTDRAFLFDGGGR